MVEPKYSTGAPVEIGRLAGWNFPFNLLGAKSKSENCMADQSFTKVKTCASTRNSGFKHACDEQEPKPAPGSVLQEV
ncbi:hypothetical protein MAH1_07940 [Sessilibacter sp. MAH1]